MTNAAANGVGAQAGTAANPPAPPKRDRLLTLRQWGRRYRVTGSAVGWWIRKGLVPGFTFKAVKSSQEPWIPLSFIEEWERRSDTIQQCPAVRKAKQRQEARASLPARVPHQKPSKQTLVEKVGKAAGITRRQAVKALEALGMHPTVRLPKSVVTKIEQAFSDGASTVTVERTEKGYATTAASKARA